MAPLGSVFFAEPSPEVVAEQRRLRSELEAYFVRLVEDRRRSPADDLLTGLVQAELEGSRLAFDELAGVFFFGVAMGEEPPGSLGNGSPGDVHSAYD